MKITRLFSSRIFSLDKFTHLVGLRKDITHILETCGIKEMTKIQNTFLTRFFSERSPRNSLILSETGSGKTLCYLLPIINTIMEAKQTKERCKASLILTSSRELTAQIAFDIKKLDPLNLLTTIRGGSFATPRRAPPQTISSNQLRTPLGWNSCDSKNYIDFLNCNIVIATPSQLSLLLEYKRIKNFELDYLVIDEGDILLDKNINHKKGVQAIIKGLKSLPSKTIVVSATFDRIIKGRPFINYLRDYFPKIEVFQNEGYMQVNPLVEHNIVEVGPLSPEKRLKLLLDLLLTSNSKHFLIFCNSNAEVEEVYNYLLGHELVALSFTSLISEEQKISAILEFKCGNYKILVASDSANRGLHFDFDPHIIQYSCAQNAVSLLHRFGRTGRLGRKGYITSFITDSDIPLISSFQELSLKAMPISSITSRKRSLSKKLK